MDDLEWKPYPRDRVIAHHPEGFSIIRPVNWESPVPIACPVCDVLMMTHDDEMAFNDLQCCNTCSMTWAAARRVEWKAGWRPSKEEIEVNVSNRPPLRSNYGE